MLQKFVFFSFFFLFLISCGKNETIKGNDSDFFLIYENDLLDNETLDFSEIDSFDEENFNDSDESIDILTDEIQEPDNLIESDPDDFGEPDEFTTDSDSQTQFFFNILVKQNPIITLTAIVETETLVACEVFVRFKEPGKVFKQTSNSKKDKKHRIIVAGMKSETLYEFEIVALLDNEEIVHKTSFTTGKLPSFMPEFEYNVFMPDKISSGITFIPIYKYIDSNSDCPEFVGIDENFDVVWYLPVNFFSKDSLISKVFKLLDNGNILLFNGFEIVIANIGGEVIERITNDDIGMIIHHDVEQLENGKFIGLSNKNSLSSVEWEKDPIIMIADEILIFDSNKNIEWSWNTLNYLDKNYFPSELSRAEMGFNTYDWTHANSIYVKNREALVGLRHHHQAIKIDITSNSLIWKFGENGNFRLLNYDRKNGIDWFYGPHSVTFASENEILLFDNGNDRLPGSSITSSRAVLYEIDETKMEATQKWQFILDYFYSKLGSVQRVHGGNYLVCGGGENKIDLAGASLIVSNIYETTSDNPGKAIWHLKIEGNSYRALKYPSLYSNK